MRNKEIWKPTKFIYKNKRLIASRNTKDVNISSVLMVDLIAEFYDSQIKIYAQGRLLDLGCGKVPLYEVYKDYVSENVCIDWGQTLHKNPYLDFESDLNKPLPFNDNEFDTIILSDVLEHLRNPELLWSEMYRVLKGGGRLIMNVPFYYWLHEEPYDYFRYTKYALKAMAEDVGFSIVLLKSIGGVPEILADLTAKNVIKIPVIGSTIAMFIQFLIKNFVRTKIGKKVSTNTGKKFPLGYCMIVEKKNNI
jgi:SAM-dependent methyltransferase